MPYQTLLQSIANREIKSFFKTRNQQKIEKQIKNPQCSCSGPSLRWALVSDKSRQSISQSWNVLRTSASYDSESLFKKSSAAQNFNLEMNANRLTSPRKEIVSCQGLDVAADTGSKGEAEVLVRLIEGQIDTRLVRFPTRKPNTLQLFFLIRWKWKNNMKII